MLRRLVLTALVTAAGVTTSLALTGADSRAVASVTVDQVYPAPASGTYTVRGHGYGHGHGLSQYGAKGAAEKGVSAQKILGFYYPGTQKTVIQGGWIKVLITGDTDPVTVAPRSGLMVRDLGAGGTSYSLPTGLGAQRWRLVAATATTDAVQWWNGSTWKPWKPGGRSALIGTGEFSGSGPVTLFTDRGPRDYRGAMRSVAPLKGSTSRDTVNVLRLDDYVKGVVAGEMPALWHRYAVRAQAVAARTYALFEREDNPGRYYDTCDTSRCQVYGGVAAEHPLGNAAADFTAGQIRTYQGKPAFTQFSSSNGGWTSAGTVHLQSVPYLPQKADPYDVASPQHDWSKQLKVSTIERAYPGIGRLLRVKVTKREGYGDWQGRVVSMVLVGSKGSHEMSGDGFKSVFGLYSNWFRL